MTVPSDTPYSHRDERSSTAEPPTAHVRFTFDDTAPPCEVRGTLELSLLAAESLYGPDRLRLEAHTHFDPLRRACTIDTSGEVGRAVAALFLGYARREFGSRAVQIHRPHVGPGGAA